MPLKIARPTRVIYISFTNEHNMKILVSACLVGKRVRYDGKLVQSVHPVLAKWHKMKILVPFCPEVEGGLSIPRPASEIIEGDGFSVLNGNAKIVNMHGRDVTGFFITGAQDALQHARRFEIELAILKDGSPSCGSSYIYDGSFSKQTKPGKGVTSALLEQNGIRVFNENNIEAISFCITKKKQF
jgi:uncharacterized protein YbbK (DUF523 family)